MSLRLPIIKVGLLCLTVGIALLGFGLKEVNAQEAATYADIKEQGIIFAGVCTSPPGSGDTCACRAQGRCELEDILQVVVNVGTFILGISGSILLLLFVYGGVVWLTSGGSPDRVTQGKKIFVGAVVGMVIIFGAYTAVTVMLSVLKTGEIPTERGQTLEDVIGFIDGECKVAGLGGEKVPCTTREDCNNYLGQGIDLLECIPKSGSSIIETLNPSPSGECSIKRPDGEPHPCSSNSDCRDFGGLNVDLGICL